MSIDNGIHLCGSCADIIDKNEGIDYSVSLLKVWKATAEKEAAKNLFQKFTANTWREINFDVLEEDITIGFQLIGLSEKHVKCCPRNNDFISEVKLKLKATKNALILSPSGSGKSLITYQVAYDLFLENYKVFKLVDFDTNQFAENTPIYEDILLVIDDAQRLSVVQLDWLISICDQNTKILLNWNSNTPFDESLKKNLSILELTPSEQVSTIKKFYLDNENIILPILQEYDSNLGEDYLNMSLSQKMDILSRNETTPWEFNYSLTNGWRNAQKEKNKLKSKNRSDIIILVIATFQVLTNDEGVPKEKITDVIIKFNSSLKWQKQAESIIDNHALNDFGFLKLKHYQYARQIITHYLPEEDPKVRKFYERFCSEAMNNPQYRNGLSSFIELILFDCKGLNYALVKGGFYEKLISSFYTKTILTSHEVFAIHSIVRATNQIQSLVDELRRNCASIKTWFSEVNNDNVFALSKLANELKYEDFEGCVLSDHLIEKLRKGLESKNIIVACMYSDLLGRIQIYIYKSDKYSPFLAALENIKPKFLLRSIPKSKLYYVSLYVSNLFYANKSASRKILVHYIDLITDYINEDPIEAFLDTQKIFDSCFGMIGKYFDRFNKNETLYDEASLFIEKINSESISNSLSNTNRRNVENFLRFLLFIDTYNNEKFREIIEAVNFDVFFTIFPERKMTEYHHRLIRYLYLSFENDIPTNLKTYFEHLQAYLDTYPSFFLVEESSKELIFNDKKKIVFEEYNLFEYLLLELVDKISIAARVIQENKNFICKNLFSPATNIDNDKDRLSFFNCLITKYLDTFLEIIKENDFSVLERKIEILARGTTTEKRTARLFLKILSHQKASQDLVLRLSKQFPKTLMMD